MNFPDGLTTNYRYGNSRWNYFRRVLRSLLLCVMTYGIAQHVSSAPGLVCVLIVFCGLALKWLVHLSTKKPPIHSSSMQTATLLRLHYLPLDCV